MNTSINKALLITFMVLSGCGKEEDDPSVNQQTGDEPCAISQISYTSEHGNYELSYVLDGDNKPIQSTMISEYSTGSKTTQALYSYDDEERLVKISEESDDRDVVIRISYSDGRVIQIKHQGSYGTSEYEYTFNYSYNTTGQLVELKCDAPTGPGYVCPYGGKYLYRTPSDVNPYRITQTNPENYTDVEYDDKPNSFRTYELLQGFLSPYHNNPIKEVEHDSYGSDTITHEYEYNNEGYVTKVTSTESDGDGSAEAVITYACK